MPEENQPTPEQIAEARKKSIDNARKTLENKLFQEVIGAATIMGNQAAYGQIAVQNAKPQYDESIASEGAQEIKKKLQEEANKEADQLGTYARPSISDYGVEREIKTQIEENKGRVSIGDLSKIVKGIAGDIGYKYKVPEALSEYIPAKINEKLRKSAIEKGVGEITKELIEESLSEEERDALNAHTILSQEYDMAVAAKIASSNYFADSEKYWSQINDKYKPKEKATA